MQDIHFSWELLHRVLEGLYFVAGVVIALAAVKALGQLRFAKEALETTRGEIRLRYERDALVLAMQQCDRFAAVIIPRTNVDIEELRKLGLANPPSALRDGDFTVLSLVDLANSKTWLLQLQTQPKVAQEIVLTLNAFEAFAMYFIKKVANEELAFETVGPIFCRFLELVSPILINLRTVSDGVPSSGEYPNSVALYRLWSHRQLARSVAASAKALGLSVSGSAPPIAPLGPR